MKPGILHGVGVGPGDPELITLKAKRILEKVPVIFIPTSQRGKTSLAYSIVNQAFSLESKTVELFLPMTRDMGELEKSWEKAAGQILEELYRGKDGAYITLGDPGTYSTFSYLQKKLQVLDHRIEVYTVPGISAVNETGAQTGEPLAEGEEGLAITNALKPLHQLEEVLDSFENIVILKAGRSTEKIIQMLKKKGLEEQTLFVSRVGFPDGFYTRDLEQVKRGDFDYLSTFLVKKGSNAR